MLFFTSLWMTQICCMCFYISQTKEKGFLSLSTYLPKVYIHLQEPKTLSIFTNFPRDFYIVSPRKIEGTLGELCFPRSIFENHYLSLGILAVCSRTKVPCKQSRIISLEKLETILSCGHMNASFNWLISRIFSVNEQYFSLTTNQSTVLSVMTYHPSEQSRTQQQTAGIKAW